MAEVPDRDWGRVDDSPPFSITKDVPRFELLSFELDTERVRSHEEFTATVRMRNDGSVGGYLLKINADDTTIHAEWILVEENETKEIRVPLRLYAGGHRVLSVEDMKADIEVDAVRLDARSGIIFSTPMLPSLVRLDEPAQFVCSARNISGCKMPVEAAVHVDEKEIIKPAPQNIQPGANFELRGETPTRLSKGLHTFRIENSPTVPFKVWDHPEETLVLHYTFDRDDEHIIDHSGFENHGIVVGDVKFVEGMRKNGIRVFNGGHVAIPDANSLAIEDETVTIMCWYKPEDEVKAGSLITKGAHIMLKMNGNFQVKLAVGGFGRGQCFYTAPTKPSVTDPVWKHEWSHFAGVCTGESLLLYYNGELCNKLRHPGKIGHTDFGWRIGSNSEIPMNREPAGIIDEVMIFAGALSARDIRAIVDDAKK
ncbi:MAG: hypothetical protein GF363_17690 [Chitinivibrionales bacterium]|nr:hypothetical protein [Chitinivibrionales bacterium]